MKHGFFLCTLLLFTCFFYTSCNTTYQPGSVDFVDYPIRAGRQADSSILLLVKPFADSVNKSMNEVIAQVEVSLEKKQPEGTLNNLVADVMMQMARAKFNTNIDAAFLNYGGIRLTQIAPGPLTKGKVYELSPFDNTIVLLTIPGNKLQEFLNLVADKGGWPATGVQMVIKDKRATSVLIKGASLDMTRSYTIATVDYVANGGDNTVMLAGLPRKDIGYLFRDALIEYFSDLNNKGKSVKAVLDGRTTLSQ